MFNKLEQFIRKGRNNAIWRGHKIPLYFEHGRTTAYQYCSVCGMGVFIDIEPDINGIEIHGKAVALNCTGRPHSLREISNRKISEAA